MDKRALQNYALWAKANLEDQIEISLKAIGINGDNDIKQARRVGEYTIIEDSFESYPADLYGKRTHIVELVKKNGYDNVIEEFAYTWFNRIVALRFMEVHDFIPHGFRVLSSRDGSFEPEILKKLNFIKDELKLDMHVVAFLQSQGKIEELYRYVLFRQCNALADILPMLFSAEDEHLELLLPSTLLKGDTIITKIFEIDEASFLEDVEVIGWLYQFYVASDRQAYRDAKLVTKDLIPTLTQVFTPDWIVRYMSENSLGRLWFESYPDSTLKSELKYYVEDARQEPEIQRKLDSIKYRNVNPEDIKVIEPCCGSGHILVYVFDLLYKMYEERGYAQREIPTLILKNNIFGLEIDKRATQLSRFALIMKARSVNNRFFNKNYYVAPNVIEIYDSLSLIAMNYKGVLKEMRLFSQTEIDALEDLVETFRYAKTIGSLLIMPKLNVTAIESILSKLSTQAVISVFTQDLIIEGSSLIKKLLMQYKIMVTKYDVMITNPPYLGISKMENNPKQWLIANYPDSKTDMFSMFMEVPYVCKNGFRAIVNPDSWMFLVSYENLRNKIIHNENIVNMIHLGMGAFDATVQTTAFVLRNTPIATNGVYYRLVDERDKEQAFLAGGGRLTANLEAFKKVSGYPIAYWATEKLIRAFIVGKQLGTIAAPRQGLATGDNDRFLKFWHEVETSNIFFSATDYIHAMYTGKKWFPCNKGGAFRKWYGNNDYVVNWQNNGKEIINFVDEKGKQRSRPQNRQYYFMEGGTWSTLSSSDFSMRYCPKGFVFETKGSMCFANEGEDLKYIIGFLNTSIVKELLLVLSPTLDYHEGPLSRVPIIVSKEIINQVHNVVDNNIVESKKDWDSFETSWDFKKHPLI